MNSYLLKLNSPWDEDKEKSGFFNISALWKTGVGRGTGLIWTIDLLRELEGDSLGMLNKILLLGR